MGEALHGIVAIEVSRHHQTKNVQFWALPVPPPLLSEQYVEMPAGSGQSEKLHFNQGNHAKLEGQNSPAALVQALPSSAEVTSLLTLPSGQPSSLHGICAGGQATVG